MLSNGFLAWKPKPAEKCIKQKSSETANQYYIQKIQRREGCSASSRKKIVGAISVTQKRKKDIHLSDAALSDDEIKAGVNISNMHQISDHS